jgi:hypothetical protein
MVVFRCYDPSSDGSGGIHWWYDRQITPEVRSAIDSALELMSREAQLDGHPKFKPLRGKCSGLAEIKIDIPIERAENSDRRPKRKRRRERTEINVRILGCNNAPNTHFTLLTGFIKKGGSDYGPACRQAHSRSKGVSKNAEKAKPCSFP